MYDLDGARKVSALAAKFRKAFSESVLNELGKTTRYCHRVRQLTPYRMVMTLMALFAGTRVESLADLLRGFNALFGYAMDYKPFYDQLAKREFAVFMRETARRLLETLVIRVLGVAPGGAFSEFRRIVIQEGSSFAIQDALKEVFPGRFKKVKPAAVELHRTLDLLDGSLSKVTLMADTASERAALPKASSLGGSLLLADRGYFDRDYLLELSEAGASFVIRAQKGLNPKVLEAFDAQGQRIRRFCGKPLKTLRFAKRGAVDQYRFSVIPMDIFSYLLSRARLAVVLAVSGGIYRERFRQRGPGELNQYRIELFGIPRNGRAVCVFV